MRQANGRENKILVIDPARAVPVLNTPRCQVAGGEIHAVNLHLADALRTGPSELNPGVGIRIRTGAGPSPINENTVVVFFRTVRA